MRKRECWTGLLSLLGPRRARGQRQGRQRGCDGPVHVNLLEPNQSSASPMQTKPKIERKICMGRRAPSGNASWGLGHRFLLQHLCRGWRWEQQGAMATPTAWRETSEGQARETGAALVAKARILRLAPQRGRQECAEPAGAVRAGRIQELPPHKAARGAAFTPLQRPSAPGPRNYPTARPEPVEGLPPIPISKRPKGRGPGGSNQMRPCVLGILFPSCHMASLLTCWMSIPTCIAQRVSVSL